MGRDQMPDGENFVEDDIVYGQASECQFISNFSLAFRSLQLDGAHANEIKHNHWPIVYVV